MTRPSVSSEGAGTPGALAVGKDSVGNKVHVILLDPAKKGGKKRKKTKRPEVKSRVALQQMFLEAPPLSASRCAMCGDVVGPQC